MADVVVTAASVKPGADAVIKTNLLSGSAVTAGDAVAKDANGAIVLADANSPTPGVATPLGFALNSAPGAGQPIAYTDDAPAMEGFATTAGIPYFLSATPGKICPAGDLASGMKTSYMGTGVAGNKLAAKVIVSGQTV
jgi:hypothetical protein